MDQNSRERERERERLCQIGNPKGVETMKIVMVNKLDDQKLNFDSLLKGCLRV